MWNKGTSFTSQSKDKTDFAIGSNISNSHYGAKKTGFFSVGFALFYFQDKFEVSYGHLEESIILSVTF